MMSMISFSSRGMAAIGLAFLAGCSTDAFRQKVPVTLMSGLAQFEVTAGEAVQNTGTVTFSTSFEIGGGSLTFDLDDISVTAADQTGGKGRVNFQESRTLEVTAWVAGPLDVETVCGSEDEYGPYEIILDEDNVPVEISPSTIELSANTRRLLNDGSLSICLEVISPVTGTVTIERLTLNLGL